MYYTKIERLEIVLDIVKKLKNYKGKNNTTVNLYNEHLCSFVAEFKEICNNYIKQDESKLEDYKGTLDFEEINKKIEYCLPCKKNKAPLFVIRGESACFQ
jgi:hypothetical protein